MSIDLEQSSYIELRSIIKERTSPVIFWVGSGISAFDDMPNWNKLKDNLILALDNKISLMDEEGSKKLTKSKNSILKQKNNWICFERLCKVLGKTTYRTTIRSSLSIKKQKSKIYQKIWNLGISGMINSNIDKLALIGYNNTFKDKVVTNFVGKRIKNFSHVLNNPKIPNYNNYLLS